MKMFFTKRGAYAGLFLSLVIGVTSSALGQTPNYVVYGVTTTNNLIRFNSARPSTILRTVGITGLQAGENVLAIDFRAAAGQLYGLGSTSRLYRINIFTGAATQIGSAGVFTLNGTDFGFDFNAAVDRIRVTSDADQNIRLNPNDGALTALDPQLSYALADPNTGQNPNVVAIAYTNSFAGATTTTLYDIDSNLDILAVQNPANTGSLSTVGPLGINITGQAGFDIATGSNIAFGSFQVTGGTMSLLYRINLSNGAATLVGSIGGLLVRDIAVWRSTASGASTVTPDFDGDGRTDYAVFRPSSNVWWINRSSDNGVTSTSWGLSATDSIRPGDYDGDGRSDIAVWRSTNGAFYVLRSSDSAVTIFQWGLSGDRPVPRDYDGDGKTDFAVARSQGGLLVWYILNSATGSIRIEQFGLGSDVVAPGDYDGDGRFDLGAYRGTPGSPAVYYVQASMAGFSAVQWGLGDDIVVPGDYDGDGKTDLAVVRTNASRTWYIRRSSDLSVYADVFGAASHYTTQGDYDGDGRTDLSTWDPVTGTFYFLRTSVPGSTSQYRFGLAGDYPVPNSDTY